MKTQVLVAIVFTCATISLAEISCTNGESVVDKKDTTQSSSGVDSMPVVKLPITDSEGVVITPPVNDSNVVVPDTSYKK